MATTKKHRYGRKWTIPETLNLQREFELLGWSLDTIAESHRRSVEAIMYKLDQEGLADFNVLYSNYHDLNSPIPVQRTYKKSGLSLSDEGSSNKEDEEYTKEDLAALAQRVSALEAKLDSLQMKFMSCK